MKTTVLADLIGHYRTHPHLAEWSAISYRYDGDHRENVLAVQLVHRGDHAKALVEWAESLNVQGGTVRVLTHRSGERVAHVSIDGLLGNTVVKIWNSVPGVESWAKDHEFVPVDRLRWSELTAADVERVA